MEPVTHLLTGACIARTGLNRKTAYATLAVTLAAEAPDIDVMFSLGGPVRGFEHHRGFTHSLLGSPCVALAVVVFVYLLDRFWLGNQRADDRLKPRWGLLFLFCWLAALSHLLLDFTNNYGIRPFMPFNWHWYSWDIVFIVDPFLLVVLTAGLVMPVFFRRDRRVEFSGRGWAVLALVFVALWWSVRDHQHRRAVSALNAQTYKGEEPTRSGAFPYPLSPWQWHGVVETKDFFQTIPVNTGSRNIVGLQAGTIFLKPAETPATLAAKQSWLGRVYLDWAQYPVVQSMPDSGDTEVLFWDLRFAYPGLQFLGRRADEPPPPPLAATVFVAPGNRVIKMEIGGREQQLN